MYMKKTYDKVFTNLYGKCTGRVVPPKFKIGDKVRVSRYKSTFEKGYEMTFHNEIYTIYKVYVGSPTVYKLIDKKDGKTIFGRFYEWKLQPANTVQRAPEVQGVADNAVQRAPQSEVSKPRTKRLNSKYEHTLSEQGSDGQSPDKKVKSPKKSKDEIRAEIKQGYISQLEENMGTNFPKLLKEFDDLGVSSEIGGPYSEHIRNVMRPISQMSWFKQEKIPDDIYDKEVGYIEEE